MDAHQWLLDIINECRQVMGAGEEPGVEPVMYISSRIKTPSSMKEKLKRSHLPIDAHSSLVLHDAVGARVVCSFKDDVYHFVDVLRTAITDDNGSIIEEKDYIGNPKPSGYRSYHMIILTPNHIKVETQIRTIAMDAWSSLEHQINYKKNINDHDGSIRALLRHCADDISATDETMMTIKHAIIHQN
jgi:putative GTP pyrophosphokinase